MSLLETILFKLDPASLPVRLLQRLAACWLAWRHPVYSHVDLLARALNHPDPQVQRIAEQGLRGLRQDFQQSQVGVLWARTRDPRLEALLRATGWIAESPPEARVLTMLLHLTPEQIGQRVGSTQVTYLLQACGDQDPRLAEKARLALLSLRRKDALNALWAIVRESGHPLALEALTRNGFKPTDENERALYLFLSGRWEEYDALDFDRRRLRAIYVTASDELRARLREQMRFAGRTDFLPVLTGGEGRLKIKALSAGDVRVIAEMLAGMNAWSELWELVPQMHAAWSAWAVDRLVAAGWKPVNPDEQALLHALWELARQGIQAVPDEIRQRHALLASHTLVRAPGRVNDVAFAPRSSWLAAAIGTQRAVLWDYAQGRRLMLLTRFNHSIGSIAVSEDEQVLLGERSNRKQAVALFAYTPPPVNNLRVLGQHQSAVMVASVPGKPWMLSAGREGRLILWNMPENRPLETYNNREGDWARHLCVVNDEYVLYAGRWMRLLHLPTLKQESWRRADDLVSAATANGGDLLLGTKFGRVFAISLQDLGRSPKRTITLHDAPIVGLASLPRSGLVLSVDGEGTLRMFDATTYTLVFELDTHKGRVTSLRISPDGVFMALGLNETAFALWDLRLLELPVIFNQPMADLGQKKAARIRQLAMHTHVQEDVRRALEFVALILQHRGRFEIELEAAPELAVGEFDIELEG